MKNLYMLFAVVFFASCANKISFQKRRYTKGYYIANHHKAKVIDHQNQVSKQFAHNNTIKDLEEVETVTVKKTKQFKAEEANNLSAAKQVLKNILAHPLALKNNVQSLKTIPHHLKAQSSKHQAKQIVQKKAMIKKIIKILFGIISGMLIIVGVIFYIAGTTHSLAYFAAYACFGGALLFIILNLGI